MRLSYGHRDRWIFVLCSLGAAALLLPLAWLCASFVQAGTPGFHWGYFIEAPAQAGRSGGIGPMVMSTLLILGVCLAAVIPLGLGTALYLSEYLPAHTRRARVLEYILDVLAGTPSIVFALFGYQFFAITLGFGFSILAGGLTLACMTLPLMVRTSEQSLRSVPADLRRAGEALAVSRAGMVWHVLLPAAMPGIVAGVILSIGRALGETAVLLFTAGYVMRVPGSLMDSGRALSVHIYDLAMNIPGGMPAAARAALVLLILIVLINMGVRKLLIRPRG